MRIGVNLLPAEVIRIRLRRHRIHRWVAIVVSVGAVSALPLGYDAIQTARAAALLGRVEPLEAQLDVVRADLKQAVTQYETLATQIARADTLRAKRPWAALLSTLTQGLPETAWLAGIQTQAATHASAPNAETEEGAAAAGPVVLDGPVGLTLTGYALDHESLYEFMARLKSGGLFAKVELSAAGKEPALNGSAVRFVLVCDW